MTATDVAVVTVPALALVGLVAWLAFRFASGTQRRHEVLVRDLMNRSQARTVEQLAAMTRLPPPQVDAKDDEPEEDDGSGGPTPNHPFLRAHRGSWRWDPACVLPNGEVGAYKVFSGPPGDRNVRDLSPSQLDGAETIVDTPASVARRDPDDED